MSNAGEIRTYKLRRSRITAGQTAAIREVGPRFLLDPDAPMPPAEWRAKFRACVLEIGFGMGEATLQYAERDPDVCIVAADLHTPGIGRLLADLDARNLENVRVVEADALALMRTVVAAATFDGVRIFFPDPWPKARHHKRRLLTSENLQLLASKVRSGGFLHFATDWLDYAEQAEAALQQSHDWQLLPAGTAMALADPAARPRTRFEQRGIDAGRSITDLTAIRR